MALAQTFRANVGIVVLNEKWEVLALERIDKEQLKKGVKNGTGEWQMPQGGLDQGEEPDDAWVRELKEEINVSKRDVELLCSYPEWMAYELPEDVRRKPEVQAKQGRGQVQKWYFVRLKSGVSIRLDIGEQEFFTYRWMALGKLAEETWEIRRLIYLRLAVHLAGLRMKQTLK
jgi:putative (di)nucleoside polyphosphate hydrolase